jgi:hypothetical protein
VLEQRKTEWIARCDDFLSRYPTSRHRPTVLWIKGITQDTQVSVLAMYDGYVRYYDEFPLTASADTWRELIATFDDDPVTAVGHLRLAHLAGRDGEVDEALAHLDAASATLVDVFAAVPATRERASWSQLFHVRTQRPSREYLQRTAHQAAKLRWLIETNRVRTNPDSMNAFREFVSLDRRRYSRGAFSDVITDLADQFVNSDFVDNFLLIEAMNHPDVHDRARQLLQLETESALDASIEANFELGRLALQRVHDEGLGRMLRRPELYFGRVKAARANPWQRQADEYLSKLSGREDPRS